MIQQQEPTTLDEDDNTSSQNLSHHHLELEQPKRLRSIDFLSGSIAAIVSDTILQPLDTVKTRQQFVGDSVASRYVYKNIFDAFLTIGRQEGMRGLFRGWVPTMFGSFPAGAIYFGTYESMKRFLLEHSTFFREHKNLAYMISGSTAEFMGSLVFVPSELVKCRFQTQSQTMDGSRMKTFQAFCQVARSDGIRGLFRGYSATMVRDIPYSMTQFLLYEVLKKSVLKRKIEQLRQTQDFDIQKVKLGFIESILVGGTAGAVAASLTNPIDVVKTRLQTSPSYKGGFLSMFSNIKQNEGWGGFFRGVTPRVLWVTLSTGIMFSVFEFISHNLTEMWLDESNTKISQ